MELLNLCEIIRKNKELSLRFLNEIDLAAYGEGLLMKRLIKDSRPAADKTTRRFQEMEYYFYINGAASIFLSWIENGMTETPDEIAELIMRLCR
jgi:hypothetical protein